MQSCATARIPCRTHLQPPQESPPYRAEFVKLNEQIEGLTHLLTLGVRVLTIMEFVLRRLFRTIKPHSPVAPGKQEKDDRQPTVERHPESVSAVSLTIVKNAAGAEIMRSG